jgi:RHS repeat-associated protein
MLNLFKTPTWELPEKHGLPYSAARVIREPATPRGHGSPCIAHSGTGCVARRRARYKRDVLGRVEFDTVTNPNGIGKVTCIGWEYDITGMPSVITSYAGTAVVNQVSRENNALGQTVSEAQSHNSLEPQPPVVGYGYADGSANHVRLQTIDYPGQALDREPRQVSLYYGPQPWILEANDLSDPAMSAVSNALARVSAIGDSLNTRTFSAAWYGYWGSQNFYGVQLPEPLLVSSLQASDPLAGPVSVAGLDTFNRQVTSNWTTLANFPTYVSLSHAYTRTDLRYFRGNALAPNRSELYWYDRVDRLRLLARGTVNAQGIVPGSGIFSQQWLLDATDNWSQFGEDPNGNNQWNVQQRFHNGANEIINLQKLSGSAAAWSIPVYDAGGNLVSAPQPATPSQKFLLDYDPWQRLVRVRSTSGGIVIENEFDGLNRRTIKRSYSQTGLNSLLATRHYYYSTDWRILDERLETIGTPLFNTPPEREYIWGARGPDDLIFRERSTAKNGVLDERLYALQDVNFNVVAAIDPSRNVQERYEFDAYGMPSFQDPTFGPRASSNFDWTVLYGGYYFDEETGLYLARGRHYHPRLGRWLQRDPAGYADSANLYDYCASSPISNVDPSGEVIFPALAWAILAIGIPSVAAAHYGAYEMGQGVALNDPARYASGQRWFGAGVVGTGIAVTLPLAGLGGPIAGSLGLTSGSLGYFAAAGAIGGGIEGAGFGAFYGGVTAYAMGEDPSGVAASVALGGIEGGISGTLFGSAFGTIGFGLNALRQSVGATRGGGFKIFNYFAQGHRLDAATQAALRSEILSYVKSRQVLSRLGLLGRANRAARRQYFSVVRQLEVVGSRRGGAAGLLLLKGETGRSLRIAINPYGRSLGVVPRRFTIGHELWHVRREALYLSLGRGSLFEREVRYSLGPRLLMGLREELLSLEPSLRMLSLQFPL